MTQPLPTALDQLLIRPIADDGTPLPTRRYANFLGNVSCADNPTFVDPNTGEIVGSTDVTIGSSNVSEALVTLAAPISTSSLAAGTRYLVDTSGGGFTQPLPTTGLKDGQWYEFTDATSSWSTAPSATKNLTLNGGTKNILDPNYIGISGVSSTSVVLMTVGETFRVTWSQAKGQWYTS